LLLAQTSGNGPGGSSSLVAPPHDGPRPGALALQLALPVDMVVRSRTAKTLGCGCRRWWNVIEPD
jgi:hypothetical protein